MSGTSLDGLDMMHAVFSFGNEKWTYEITAAETIAYDHKWRIRLGQLHEQPAFLYPKTDLFFGRYIGKCVHEFMIKHNLNPDLIASHGHTIFHQPHEGYTAQIGNGGAIHQATGIKVVNDFRTQDVLLGGQGAPLVPIGDELLFSEYDACLNLGGFANISFRENGIRKAYDISFCNLVLNHLALIAGAPYDDEGKIAASGKVDSNLLNKLNSLEYYQKPIPKSLGREWVEQDILPHLKLTLHAEDLLATCTEHISLQLANALEKTHSKTVLITGGGAYNSFLLERLQAHWTGSFVLPERSLIEQKESLIFGFLGLLRSLKQVNILASVTGAKHDHSSGMVWD